VIIDDFVIDDAVMNDEPIDVAIIGGGPAGSAAAIRCAQRGLSVVIVDPAPGRGDRPGETLHPGAGVIFETLGVARQLDAAGIVRHAGQWIESATTATFESFGRDGAGAWRGYQIPAAVLDPILLDRAVACGAEIRRELAEKPIVRDGRVEGIRTSSGALRARIVIDASGRRQWLAIARGLTRELRSPPLLAFYGYLRNRNVPGAPRFRALDNGWEWTAPISEGRTAWVQLALADDASRVRAEAPALDAEPRAADVTWRIARPAAGPGYFLAGDAAFVLDPASSHGVLKALLSGTNAAVCAADLLHGAASENAICQAYDQWIAEMFEHDVQGLMKIYEEMGCALLTKPLARLARPSSS
jgi:flavin-dependent dehydrogenase